MKTKILIILLTTALFISCKTEKKETLQPNEFTKIKIELKNGKKWLVDKPMMAHIQNIKNDVIQFNGKSLEDYRELSNKIDKNLDLLTLNCTMTGQGHDELHKWLLPFLDVSKQFSDTKTIEKAKDNYQIIKYSFTLLNENFK